MSFLKHNLKHKKCCLIAIFRCLIAIFIVTLAFVEEQKHEGCS